MTWSLRLVLPSGSYVSIVDFVKLISKTQRGMWPTIERGYDIKFCAKLDKSYTDTNKLILQVPEDSALSSSQDSRCVGKEIAASRCVRKEIGATWMLRHDNAPSTTSLRVREFLRNTPTLSQLLYILHWASADFFLFPKIKTALNEVSIEAFESSYFACANRWKIV